MPASDNLAEAERPNFDGHPNRECGEHRTVGPVRAWCFDCRQWCYPGAGCARCELPALRRIVEAASVLAPMWHSISLGEFPVVHEWPGLADALDTLAEAVQAYREGDPNG